MKILNMYIKRILVVVLAFLFFTMPVYSKNLVNMHATITSDFSTDNIPDIVQFKTIKKVKILDDIVIPQRSVITAEVYQTRKERRWHKSGFIICKVKNFVTDTSDIPVDLSDKDLYIVARKYEKVDKKEVAIVSTEILLTQAASFFAPGVDILYFFTKGAIQRKKHPNWFRAGVSNAYDNSICWFWLKGKPIDLSEGQEIKIKDIKLEKADKIKAQCQKQEQHKQKLIAKKNEKLAAKNLKKSSPEENEHSIESPDVVLAAVEKQLSTDFEIVANDRTRVILTDYINIATGRSE